MSIPVANLYYLYCYAWQLFSATENTRVLEENAPNSTADLWALVLAEAFSRQVRRGLDYGYRVEDGRLMLPRGRIHPLRSTTSGALAIGQLECTWDEFVADTYPNRVIKYTMRKLANCREVDDKHAHRLRKLYQAIPQVSDITPTLREIKSIQLNRNNASYRLMLDVCLHVIEFLMPLDNEGNSTFRDPRRDDAHMARVFENFLMSWYRRHANPSEFTSISSTNMSWPVIPLDDPNDLKFVPIMKTDITMTGFARTVIIDAKYYHETLVASRQNALPKIISKHLYQLHTYLSIWENDHPNGPHPEGILLYPTVQDHVELNLKIHGYPIRVVTVNLDQPWSKIGKELTGIIRPFKNVNFNG